MVECRGDPARIDRLDAWEIHDSKFISSEYFRQSTE